MCVIGKGVVSVSTAFGFDKILKSAATGAAKLAKMEAVQKAAITGGVLGATATGIYGTKYYKFKTEIEPDIIKTYSDQVQINELNKERIIALCAKQKGRQDEKAQRCLDLYMRRWDESNPPRFLESVSKRNTERSVYEEKWKGLLGKEAEGCKDTIDMIGDNFVSSVDLWNNNDSIKSAAVENGFSDTMCPNLFSSAQPLDYKEILRLNSPQLGPVQELISTLGSTNIV